MKRLALIAILAASGTAAIHAAPAQAQDAAPKRSKYACYPTDRGCCSDGKNYDTGSYNRDNEFCATTVAHPSNGPIGGGEGGKSSKQTTEVNYAVQPAQAPRAAAASVAAQPVPAPAPAAVTPPPASVQQGAAAIKQGASAATAPVPTQGAVQGNLANKTQTP